MNRYALPAAAAAIAAIFCGGGLRADSLFDGFAAPPRDARPQVWWHWIDGNVSKEGITADLEAMARAGIGGAEIIDLYRGMTPGPVRFGTDGWFGMLKFANDEAKRLGIDLVLQNCSGWSQSGGPWVAPEDSMKDVVFSERVLAGGETLDAPPPAATNKFGFYRDIATLAFPRPAGEDADPADYGMKSTFMPGDCAVKIDFEKPFPLTGVMLDIETAGGYHAAKANLEISEDGENFRRVVDGMPIYTARYQVRGGKFFVAVPGGAPAMVRALKVVCDTTVEPAFAGPVWEGMSAVRPKNAKGLSSPGQKLVAVTPLARAAIPEFSSKIFKMRSKIHGWKYCAPGALAVDPARIVDITGNEAGWKAPEGGDWVVVRFGYVSNGMENHPATPAGRGLEVDKLSKGAVRRFFDGYIGKAIKAMGPRSSGGGLSIIHVDSYEVGGQTWTEGFDKAFAEQTGMDIKPYLPVFTGRVVGSPEETEKMLSGFRRTVSGLLVENYAKEFKRLCNESGLEFSLEGYGCCPCDDLRYAAQCDIPMAEFWAGQAWPAEKARRIGDTGNSRFAGFVSHVWGQRVVGAEAFTSLSERYNRDPFQCKAQCDRVYAQGVNRIVYHSCTHQPWPRRGVLPGMTMGAVGSHFETTQTWWNDGGAAFFKYQARCQWMLQEGLAAPDVLVFSGDNPASHGLDLSRWHDYGLVGENAFGAGRQWDVCAGDALREFRADGGEAVAPAGTRYKAVALLPGIPIDAESQAALDRLAAAGVPVVPARDVHKTLVGKGIGPDVFCLTKEHAKDFRWFHRRERGGGDGEWYFVALPNEEETQIELSFRVAGKTPEIWDPETGAKREPLSWKETKNGRTAVALSLPPSGSAFVVFRKPSTGESRESGNSRVSRSSRASRESSASGALPVANWRVTFPVGWYFGKDDAKTVEMASLADWTSFDDPDIKYFSGTAVYETEVEIPGEWCATDCGRVLLDLGNVKNIATVTVNGKQFPVLWKPPYRVDITDAVEQAGNSGKAATLAISVRVTNLWPNRLIGDDMLPEGDANYVMPSKRWKGGALKKIPERVWRGEPSPSGRHTLVTWRHWKKDDKLLPSGLLGPVRLELRK